VTAMAALVRAVDGLDKSAATVPALFRIAEADRVVRADATLEVARDWGAEAEVQRVEMGPGDDPAAHVIAGDILSPGQTEPALRDILDWLARQGIG
ncbi:alpha/beta hydrolase, partial [Cribrihabitans sp. XS_ASV171]